MTEGSPHYKPGDVVNGHVLTGDGQWVPVTNDVMPVHPQPRDAKSAAAKIGMGLLLIVGVGWLLVGTVLGIVLGAISADRTVTLLGPVAGIVVGVLLFRRWLGRSAG